MTRLRLIALLLLAPLLFTACSDDGDPQEEAVKIPAGAEKALARFRELMKAGDYKTLYAESTPSIHESSSEAEFLGQMGTITETLGEPVSTKLIGSEEMSGPKGEFFKLIHDTTFTKRRMVERFTFKRDGEKLLLEGYFLQNP